MKLSSPMYFGQNTPPFSRNARSAQGKTERQWLEEVSRKADRNSTSGEMQDKAAMWFKRYHAKEKSKAQQDPAQDAFKKQNG